MLSGRQSLYSIGAQVLIAFTTIIAVTVLSYSDKLDGQAVTALFGMAIGLAGGTAAAVSQGSSPSSTTTPTRVTTPQGVTVETNGAIGKPDAATPEE